MDSFVTRHASDVKGTLSGFDRVRFRGTLRWLANLREMGVWLAQQLLKRGIDFERRDNCFVDVADVRWPE